MGSLSRARQLKEAVTKACTLRIVRQFPMSAQERTQRATLAETGVSLGHADAQPDAAADARALKPTPLPLRKAPLTLLEPESLDRRCQSIICRATCRSQEIAQSASHLTQSDSHMGESSTA
jgi:hypothetical protein